MTQTRSPSGLKGLRLKPATASLALLAGLPAASPAWAQRALELSAEDRGDYARIVAKWSDGDETAPTFEAEALSQVLVLRFDEPIATDFSTIPETLPDWVAMARLDPDGQALRLALKKTPEIHQSTSVDLAAIDMTPEAATTAPPPIVSPLVAVRAAAAEAARLASIPPPPPIKELEIRSADSGERSRIAFYWTGETEYEVIETDTEIRILFDHRAEPDIARLKIYPPEYVDKFDAYNTDRGFEVVLNPYGDVKTTHYKDGATVVIDLAPPAKPPPRSSRRSAARADEDNSVDPSPVADASPDVASDPAPGPATPGLETARSQATTIQADATPDAANAPAAADAGPIELAEKYAGMSLVEASPVSNARVTQLEGGWPDPAPKSGELEIKVRPLPSGMELFVHWDAPAPAAVFMRPPAVWAVFAAKAKMSIDESALPVGFKVEPIETEKASLLRITAPDGMVVSARSEGPDWRIQITPSGITPNRFVTPTRKLSDTGRASIRTRLIGAAGIVWFDDPVIGDRIAAVTAFGPASASTTPRSFIEARLPATAHGLAIAPKADDVTVALEDETVIVSGELGLAVSRNVSAADIAGYTPMTTDTPTPGFIDFDAWGGHESAAWFRRKQELERAVAARDQASNAGSDVLIELARFYLAHDMAIEALATLRVALDGRHMAEQDARFLALRGAANAMAGRYDEVEVDLSKGPLRGDASAALWRGYVAAKRGQWDRAREFFQSGEELLHVYSERWAARFYAASAEAAFHANDLDTARRHADRAISMGYQEAAEQGALVLAHLAGVTTGPDAAYQKYRTLASNASEPIAVIAELRSLELAGELGVLSATAAAEKLEALRYRWRGDDIEMQTIGILADQHMRLGRFREALTLAQATALRDTEAPGARYLRVRLIDYFRTLFLEGEADRLDPIQALALFYEFRGLTPIGADGDRMIRKLARRLVSFDLLEPATELLQHQVDNRVRGVGKASIAADLASIYLMNREPDRALSAINASRQPSLPRGLAKERRILEAAALRDLGRYDHSVELLEGVDGEEAASLRADAFWQDGKWSDAAKTLIRINQQYAANDDRRRDVALKAAIAGRMAKDLEVLANIRSAYGAIFEGDENAESFELLTSQTEVAGAALSEAVRRLADAPRIDAFAESIKSRFAAGGDDQADASASDGEGGA